MSGFDIDSILREFDEKQGLGVQVQPEAGKKPAMGGGSSGGQGQNQAAQASSAPAPAAAPPVSRAEEIADNELGNASRERQIRNAVSDAEKQALLEKAAGKELEKDGPKIEATAYQRRAVAMCMNALNVRNAQAVIAISNREGIRKGLSKEPELQKPIGRGQMSTIAIPTALLRYVQQEIGPLSGRTSQNDIVTGFLYWYFGQPQEVSFPSPDSAAKASEIVSNLDLNASPAKFNRVNYNMSGNLLERLDEIRDRLDAVAAWMQADMRDSVASRVQADKSYIALCYLILSFSALAPPVMPGQSPEDIDMLAQGGVWDLMTGLDGAYDYFKARNGREIYKARHGIRPAPKMQPAAPAPAPFDDGTAKPLYSGGADADPDEDTGGYGREEYDEDEDPYTGDDGDGYREVDDFDDDAGGFGGSFSDSEEDYYADEDVDTSYEGDAEAGDCFAATDPIKEIRQQASMRSITSKMAAKLAAESSSS